MSKKFKIKNPFPLALSMFNIITFITLNVQVYFPKLYIVVLMLSTICILVVLFYITSNKITKKNIKTII